MPTRNDIEDINRDNRTPAAMPSRLGHRIREIRHQLSLRHHGANRYHVTPAHPAPRPPAGRVPVFALSSDEYQASVYMRSRSTNRRERLTAVREAIATSPYTWEDMTADGVREWVEESIGDDVLVASAVESLGDLESGQFPYLGKFTAEMIYEMLVDKEAAYWGAYWGKASSGPL